MKNNNRHLITETYYSPLGWNAKKCMNALKDTVLKYFKKGDFYSEFDGEFVPEKCFSWKKVFKQTPEIELFTSGKAGMKIVLMYNYKITGKELLGLLFGSEKDNKYGGIAWNPEFKEKLESLGFGASLDPFHTPASDETEEFDDDEPDVESVNDFIKAYKDIIFEEPEEDEDPDFDDPNESKKMKDTMNFTVSISFVRFNLTDKVKNKNKPKNKYNANYISNLSGSISFDFGDEDLIKVGTIKYIPKRTKNMDPQDPPSFAKTVKDVWNGNAKSDFGLLGVALKGAMKAAAGNIAGRLETVQEESCDIDIDAKFDYENNAIMGIQSRASKSISNSKLTTKEAINDIKEFINSSIKENDSLKSEGVKSEVRIKTTYLEIDFIDKSKNVICTVRGDYIK